MSNIIVGDRYSLEAILGYVADGWKINNPIKYGNGINIGTIDSVLDVYPFTS